MKLETKKTISLRYLGYSLIELSIILRESSLKESLSDNFSESIKNILDIIDELENVLKVKDFSNFSQNDATRINENFKNIADDISIFIASFNEFKASEFEKNQYRILLKDLSLLEKLKYKIEKNTGYHIVRIKPSLEKGKRLMVENLNNFLKDLNYALQEKKK